MTSSIVKCCNCNIVISEILAFIQNKVDVMDEESIVRICSSAFPADEIERAKCLLFESITTSKRKITRKRDGRTQRDLYDVIAVFKETDPEETPIFVARELQKLPPVTFDHIDATRFLKDILIIQKELAALKESCVTIDQFNEVRRELQNTKQTSLYNYESYVNKKRGGGGLTNSYFMDSGPTGLPHIVEQNTSPNKQECTNTSQGKECLVASLSRPHASDDCVPLAQDSSEKEDRRVEASTVVSDVENSLVHTRKGGLSTGACASMNHQAASTPSGNKTFAQVLGADRLWEKEKQDVKWITVQRKRLKNRFSATQGKAVINVEDKFRAAETKISLFVNNVSLDTSEDDISQYIFDRTQIKVVLSKISPKSPRQYNSYRIEVPKTKLSLFLDDSFWPEGITFRKFVVFKPNRNYGRHDRKQK